MMGFCGHFPGSYKILRKYRSSNYLYIVLMQEAMIHTNAAGNITGTRDMSDDQEGAFRPEMCILGKECCFGIVSKRKVLLKVCL